MPHDDHLAARYGESPITVDAQPGSPGSRWRPLIGYTRAGASAAANMRKCSAAKNSNPRSTKSPPRRPPYPQRRRSTDASTPRSTKTAPSPNTPSSSLARNLASDRLDDTAASGSECLGTITIWMVWCEVRVRTMRRSACERDEPANNLRGARNIGAEMAQDASVYR